MKANSTDRHLKVKRIIIKGLKVLYAIIVTMIPTVFFYFPNIKTIKTMMNIITYYQGHINTLILLLLVGFIIAILSLLYYEQYRLAKQMKKAIYDHALRLRLYQSIFHWIMVNKITEVSFSDIQTITDDEKRLLGFTDDQIKSSEKFQIPTSLTKSMVVDEYETWKMLKQEYNNKNRPIK